MKVLVSLAKEMVVDAVKYLLFMGVMFGIANIYCAINGMNQSDDIVEIVAVMMLAIVFFVMSDCRAQMKRQHDSIEVLQSVLDKMEMPTTSVVVGYSAKTSKRVCFVSELDADSKEKSE